MRKLTKNKKGAEMTIGTIVIIVLALIVLVVLIVGFTSGWGNLWDKIRAFFGGGDNVSTMVTSCQTACGSSLKYDYCDKEREVRFENKAKTGIYNCKALEGENVGLTPCEAGFDSCAVIKKLDCEDAYNAEWVAPESGECPKKTDGTARTKIESAQLSDSNGDNICCVKA